MTLILDKDFEDNTMVCDQGDDTIDYSYLLDRIDVNDEVFMDKENWE